MKKPCVLLLMLSCLQITSNSKPLKPEAYYQNLFAERHSGQEEVTMPDKTRSDIVTPDYAIEVDFAKKWSEAIGQSLYYGIQSNKKSGILLIIENSEDRRFLIRLGTVVNHHELPITVWTIDATGNIVKALPIE